jgi:hypothetical protein
MTRSEAEEYIMLRQTKQRDIARYVRLIDKTAMLAFHEFVRLRDSASIEELDAKGGITYED